MKTEDVIFDILDSLEMHNLTKSEAIEAIMKVIEDNKDSDLSLITLKYRLISHPIQSPYVKIDLTEITEGVFDFTGKIKVTRINGEGDIIFKSIQIGERVVDYNEFISPIDSHLRYSVSCVLEFSIKRGDKFKFTPANEKYNINSIVMYPSEIEN